MILHEYVLEKVRRPLPSLCIRKDDGMANLTWKWMISSISPASLTMQTLAAFINQLRQQSVGISEVLPSAFYFSRRDYGLGVSAFLWKCPRTERACPHEWSANRDKEFSLSMENAGQDLPVSLWILAGAAVLSLSVADVTSRAMLRALLMRFGRTKKIAYNFCYA